MTERSMTYSDFEIQQTFEGLSEQILDYLGIEKGRNFLYANFKGFESAVDLKIAEYEKGNRITEKQENPDPGIIRICGGYK